MRKLFICFAILACTALLASAQTVTVAPSGADYTNLLDAVNSFNPGGANASNTADNVINITVGTTYVESSQINILADGNWTIDCTDPNSSATLVIPSPGDATKGLISTGDIVSPYNVGISGSVTLKNLVILPGDVAGSGPQTTDCNGINLEWGTTGNLAGYLTNVMVSANNGSNQPASDGTYAATGHYTAITGAGLRMLSGTNTLDLERVTMTHCGDGVSDNGDINGSGDVRVIGPGCTFSYNAGAGYYLSGGDLTSINGTAAHPDIFAHNTFGLRFNSSGNSIGDVTYCRFLYNRDEADINIGSGIHFVGASQVNNGKFFKCFIAFNGSGTGSDGLSYGNISANNSATTTFRFDQCTIFDAYSDQPTFTELNNSGGDANFDFTDCIFAGGLASTPDDFLRSSEADAVVTLTNCALVTQGPYALDTIRATDPIHATSYSGTGLGGFVFNNIIFTNPIFASTDAGSPNFLDVTAADYATASSTGGPLSGAANYVPRYFAAAGSAWSLYQ